MKKATHQVALYVSLLGTSTIYGSNHRCLIDSVGDKQSDVRLSVLGPWDDVKTPDGLRKFLHENIADGFGKQGFFTLDHPIVIRPTTGANWEHVLAVYNAAVHAEYTNITLDEPTP